MLSHVSLCALLALTLLTSGVTCNDIFSDVGKSLNNVGKTLSGQSDSGGTGVNFNLNDGGASIEVKVDDGNPFYYKMCGAGVSPSAGFDAGCRRVWKPLFYVCIAAGGLLALFLLSCCCCCCCAPCRKNRTVYRPVMSQSSQVVVNSYDAPMLSA